MISTNEFQKGLVIEINNEPWQIVNYQFVNPGKGAAFMKTSLKNLKTGKAVEKTFKSGESFEEVGLEYKKARFIYQDRQNAVFSLLDNQERISLPKQTLEWELNFLTPNLEVNLIYLGNQVHGIKLPPKVQLKITQAPPAIKGNTATGAKKTVVLETGYSVLAPIFIGQDESIWVNTETGEYSGKVG
ncbi:MAG: elongation factor P [Patescibacteria group bacterium]